MFRVPPSEQDKSISNHLSHAEQQDQKRKKRAKFVFFNEYYMMLVVVTAREVKMYRMRDGFMQVLHSNFF